MTDLTRVKALLSEQLSHDLTRIDLLAILKVLEIVEDLQRRVAELEG